MKKVFILALPLFAVLLSVVPLAQIPKPMSPLTKPATLLAELAKPGQSFAFLFRDSDFKNYSIVRFEMRLDTQTPVNIKVPISTTPDPNDPDMKEYEVLIPAITPGDHTVAFRACNATPLCGDWGTPFAFTFEVKIPTVTDIRIK